MNNHHILDASAIVSGSDVPHDHFDSSSDEDAQLHNKGPTDMNLADTDDDADSTKYNIPAKDELYNPNEDEEDEAYVYQHLRGGIEETVPIRRRQSQGTTKDNYSGNEDMDSGEKSSISTVNDTTKSHSKSTKSTNSTTGKADQSFTREQAKILKPRSSDAVLSCPCCFQIVCMDCQRHERYANQFRAMFVMNIGVSWDRYLNPDNLDKANRIGISSAVDSDDITNQAPKKARNEEDISKSVKIPHHEAKGITTAEELTAGDLYYSVHCSNCNTEVAALDMTDEVYHFFGCLVSS